MGKLQKVSGQHSINIFEAILNDHVTAKDRTPEIKANSPTTKQSEKDSRSKDKRNEWETPSVSQKLSHNNPEEIDLTRRGNSIRSARCESTGITNQGGSGRFVGASKNSIANAEFLDQVAKMQTNRESTTEEKRASASVRKMKQAEYRSANGPRVGESEEAYLSARGNGVTPNHRAQGNKYTPGIGSISIFDDKDFERIPADHKMEVRAQVKDDSWKIPTKAKTIGDSGNRLFDNLTDQSEASKGKSLHRDSTDRLYEALLNNIKKDQG